MTTIYSIFCDDEPTYYKSKREAIKEARIIAKLTPGGGDVIVDRCVVAKMRERERTIRLLTGGWCEEQTEVFRVKCPKE